MIIGAKLMGHDPMPLGCLFAEVVQVNDTVADVSQDFALGHTNTSQQFGFLTGYPLTRHVGAAHVDQQRAHGCSISNSFNLAR